MSQTFLVSTGLLWSKVLKASLKGRSITRLKFMINVLKYAQLVVMGFTFSAVNTEIL